MLVREALPGDAAVACRVLRASITRLCTADHRDDPAILGAWLANKTPRTVGGWIAAPGHTVLVVERAGVVVGVGGVADRGEITLNYVAPVARLQGVSTALLRALEQRLRDQGVRRSRLVSTVTAHGFYRRRGYVDVDRSIGKGGMIDHHMAKQLEEDA